jgi:cytidylate kinase
VTTKTICMPIVSPAPVDPGVSLDVGERGGRPLQFRCSAAECPEWNASKVCGTSVAATRRYPPRDALPMPDLVNPASQPGLVVALDGPASSGKSSVGSAGAKQLGYRFCDTGLLYRAVTWLALHRGVNPEDTDALVRLVDEIHLLDDGGGRLAHVAVDEVDRTAEVRTPEVDAAVSLYSSVGDLRLALLQRQRALAADGRIIMAGRDIGTFVLPDADLKLFLNASVEERARRRALEREIHPDSAEGQEILEELRRRDHLDTTREIAPLRPAEDAVIIKTDGNTFELTVAIVVDIIRRAETERFGAAAESSAEEVEPQPGGEAEGSSPIETSNAAEGSTGSASSRAHALPAAGTAAAAVEPAEPKRSEHRPAIARRPMQSTPVATRLDPLVRLGSAVLRFIVRAIVRLRVEGDLSAIPRHGPLIVAANHASSADPVLIGAFLNEAIGRPLNWLGKRELTEFPLTGWAFRRAGIHPVDRDAADLEAFRTAMRILEAGHVLAVFPEGTRSRDGALQQVREGVGMLALRSGATVLPVAVVDSDLMWPRGSLLPRYGKRVTVRYGTPFKVADELPGGASGRTSRRGTTEAATRLIMSRIAALLPQRQRGLYAASVEPGVVPSREVD